MSSRHTDVGQRDAALLLLRQEKTVEVFSLKKKRLLGDLSMALLYLKRAYKKDRGRLYIKLCRDRTRRDGFKLKESKIR